MAASNPNGEMQFWFNGLPFGGIQKSSYDAGEMQFWFNGAPCPYIFPTSSTLANLKTDNGLAKASIKTFNGLGIASTKTKNGLT